MKASRRRASSLRTTERGKAYHRDTCDVILAAILETRRVITVTPTLIAERRLFPCRTCDPPRLPDLRVVKDLDDASRCYPGVCAACGQADVVTLDRSGELLCTGCASLPTL